MHADVDRDIRPTSAAPPRILALAGALLRAASGALLPLAAAASAVTTAAAAEGAAPAAASAAPTMMATRLHGYGGVENLRYESAPRPVAGPGKVRVRVLAAGINPFDWKFRDGNLRRFLQPALPLVQGLEFAGVVEQVGNGVRRWTGGEEVYGFVGEDGAGTYAEYVVVPEANLARKPPALGFDEAAAIPVAAQTAWKMLFETANLQPRQRLLLQGGSGAVGLAAIQLARQRDVEVTAVASTANQELMRRAGANRTIDYRKQRVSDVAGLHDVVIDGVGARTIAESLQLVREGGTLVGLNAPADAAACAARKVRCLLLQNFRASPAAVQAITRLVEEGRLRVPVGAIYPLAEAAAAQERSRSAAPGGKIVLRVAQR